MPRIISLPIMISFPEPNIQHARFNSQNLILLKLIYMVDPIGFPISPPLIQCVTLMPLKYLDMMISPHRHLPNNPCHKDLIQRAQPKSFIFRIPQPLKLLGMLIFPILVRWNLKDFSDLAQINFAIIPLIFLVIVTGRQQRCAQYIANCCRTDYVRMTLSPRVKHLCSHSEIFFWNLSTIHNQSLTL